MNERASARPRTGRSRRPGFTLIEMGVTLAIIGVIAGIAVSVMHGIVLGTNFNATSAGLVADIRKIRADSFGSGFSTVFVINATTGQYWGIEDDAGTFSLATFDPANPAPAPAKLLVSNTLPAPVVIGPATGYGQALPRPYAWVHDGNACTFCQGSAGAYGSITFQGREGSIFSGPNLSDGSFSIQSPRDSGGWVFTTIALVGRTGAIETFNGSHS